MSPSRGPEASAQADAAVPRFKWGQTKEKVFLTIAVRDLDRASVDIQFKEDRLSFTSRDAAGKAYALNLELAQDAAPEGCHWEHIPRKDRWGDAVLATILKRFPAPWEALVQDPPAAYQKAMDRDWAREDQALEQLEEDPFFAEHAEYLQDVTEVTLPQARQGVEALVLLVRHIACKQCKVADDTFAAVAKQVSDPKKGSWQARVRVAVVDPRRHGRSLARRLGAACPATPTDCRHYMLGPRGQGGETAERLQEPIRIRGRHQQAPLLDDLRLLARRQFLPAGPALEQLSAAAARGDGVSRGLAVLRPDAPTELSAAAHRLRLRVDVAVAAPSDISFLGEEGDASAWAWQPYEVRPTAFPGTAALSSFESWLRARAVPLLANTSTFEEDEPYEDLALPVARLFLNGSAGDVEARAAVWDVARDFIGRVAFMARNATSKSHEWRQHGLPPGRFPSFALGLSMRHNATKFAFLEGVQKDAVSIKAFWSGPGRSKLAGFLEDALAGRLAPSRMSEEPPEDEEPAVQGASSSRVRRMVGRTCRAVVEASQTEVLVEAFDEWRRDHKQRTLRLDLLAPMLARCNITVYRLDLGYNECPADLLPMIPAGYSGYYWVPRLSRERGKKWQKLKKLDPPFDRVLAFVEKHTEVRPKPNATLLFKELESAATRIEQIEAAKAVASDWRVWAGTAAVGLLGAVFFLLLRIRAWRRKPAPFGPEAPPGYQPAAAGAGDASEQAPAAGEPPDAAGAL